MSWSGGAANRTWQRGRRGPDDGRLGLHEDIVQILTPWRFSHGWQPGYVWNPVEGLYVSPLSLTCIPAGQPTDKRGHP